MLFHNPISSNVNRCFCVVMVTMTLKIFSIKHVLDKAKNKSKHLSERCSSMSKVTKFLLD